MKNAYVLQISNQFHNIIWKEKNKEYEMLSRFHTKLYTELHIVLWLVKLLCRVQRKRQYAKPRDLWNKLIHQQVLSNQQLHTQQELSEF